MLSYNYRIHYHIQHTGKCIEGGIATFLGAIAADALLGSVLLSNMGQVLHCIVLYSLVYYSIHTITRFQAISVGLNQEDVADLIDDTNGVCTSVLLLCCHAAHVLTHATQTHSQSVRD